MVWCQSESTVVSRASVVVLLTYLRTGETRPTPTEDPVRVGETVVLPDEPRRERDVLPAPIDGSGAVALISRADTR